MYALRQAINEYFIEGEQQRYERYNEMYETLLDGLAEMGFQLLVPREHHAKILTAIIEPEDPRYSFDGMHDYLYARGFTIYPGKGAKRNTFRLATMGALTAPDIRQFLACLKNYLTENQIELAR